MDTYYDFFEEAGILTESLKDGKIILSKERIDLIKKIALLSEIKTTNRTFFNTKKECTQTLLRVSYFIDDYLYLHFRNHSFDSVWKERNEIDILSLKKKTIDEKIELLFKAAKRYSRMKIYGNWPFDKNILSNNLLELFYNSKIGNSWILYCVFNTVKSIGDVISSKNFNSVLPSEIREYTKKLIDLYNYDTTIFKTFIVTLYVWWRDNKENLHLVNGGGFYSWGNSFEDLIDRMIDFFSGWNGGAKAHNFKHDSKSWDCFCKHIEEKYKVKLNPTAAEIEYARKQKEKWNEEDKRKSRYEELKQKKNVSDELAGYIEGGKVK